MNAALALMLGSAALAGLAAAARPDPVQPDHHHHSPAAAAAPAATTEAQLQILRQALARYADFEVARREGWKKFGGMRSGEGPLMGEHWYLPPRQGGPDYQHGQAIDFRRPSNLIYAEIGGKRVLVGVTFNVRLAEGEPVPEGFAGPADRWHVGLNSGNKDELNRMAEHGWAIFSAAWISALTPVQQARIAALTEHGDAGPLAHEDKPPLEHQHQHQH